MTHTESNVKIYFTKDYARFVKLNGNRDLNTSKINRIKDDIRNGTDVLKYCPIIVANKDGKLEVIDGQHRLAVAKQLGSHVWYIMASELSLLEIARVNSNTEKWKAKDFINCYSSQGNKNYKILEDFMDQYGFPLSVCLDLLMSGNKANDGGDGESAKHLFQNGGFKVKAESEAKRVAEIVGQFKEFPRYNSRTFIVALCKIIGSGKVEIEKVVTAYEKNKEALVKQPSWKEYLVNLESILNIGKQKRIVIF